MKKCFALAALVLCMVLVLASCGGDAHSKELIAHLAFDEGSGTTVKDSAGKLPDTDLSYQFSHATYMEDQEPQWREEGISGGCVLLDGTSTYVSYKRNDVTVEGPALTVQAWIAPRTFEWDDPHAAENGTDSLTGIVCQFDKDAKKGFILGYERFGRLSFQVGTGYEWLSVWSDEVRLQKYAWNLVTATYDEDEGKMCLYLNGELVGSGFSGGNIVGANNKGLTVGRNQNPVENLVAGNVNAASGYLDEVKLWSTALTAEEIKEYYDGVEVPEIEFSDIWLQNILTGDYTRPQFHAGPYQFWMNEPHAPVYYNGVYHLFFQENMTGSYWRNICWGHMVSEDMVNWRPVKEAITPTEGSVVPDGVWSGGAALDKNGVPLLFFTAGNDAFRDTPGLISNQNIGVAYPADLSDPELTDWVICDELAVIQQQGQGRAGEFRDPSIWKEGDSWYMVVCSGSATTNGGTALLYTSDTLELKDDGTVEQNWVYKGPVYEMPNQSSLYGTSWELPILLPVSNEAGTVTKYFFSISPAPASSADNKVYYWLGDFDAESGKFTPDPEFGEQPRLLDYGANVFTGPSCLVDPVSGDIYMFSIMQDQRGAAEQGASGWAHTVGIARRIWLSDDGSDMMISPIDTLATLEEETLADLENVGIEDANAALEGIDEDMLYIRLTADVSGASEFGISLKQGGKWDATTYTYDVGEGTISGHTENKGEGCKASTASGPLAAPDGKLTMEIYVDRSLVEGFFNDAKALSIRAYTDDPESHGMDLFATGNVTIEELYVARMGGIF